MYPIYVYPIYVPLTSKTSTGTAILQITPVVSRAKQIIIDVFLKQKQKEQKCIFVFIFICYYLF